jgi:hypothetical protein
MKIECWKDLIIALRMGKYTSVGSYPLFYITAEGQPLSYKHVRDEALDEARKIRNGESGRIVGCDINYENDDLWCDETNTRIESAYAEDQVSSFNRHH